MSILNLPGIQAVTVNQTDQHYQITAKTTHPPAYCPNCQSTSIVSFGGRDLFFSDTPIHGKQVGIKMKRKRYSCKTYLKTFIEPLPMMDDKRSATKRLVEYIEKNSLKKTFASISEEIGVDEKTVRNIFTEYTQRLKKEYKAETPRCLGIDEIYVIKKSRCVLNNIEKKIIIDMLPDRNKATVTQYLCNIHDYRNIEVVCMDMWRPYKDAVNDVLPGRQIIIDKFHTVRMANQALETVRKSMRGQLKDKERRTLKDDRYVLLKRNYNLDSEDMIKLDVWSKNFPALGASYDLKEWFFNIWDSQDRKEAEERYNAWAASIPADLHSTWEFVLTAVRNWRDEIFSYFDLPEPLTNAFTESINNIVRTTNRMGRGYSFDVLRAKMLYSKAIENKATKFPKRNFPMPEGALTFWMTTKPEEDDDKYYGVEISTVLEMIEQGEL